MKKFFLIITLFSKSLFAQTPLSLEEVKALILQNVNNLSYYKQGSVFQEISRQYQKTADGRICEYESTRIDTLLLVPEQEDEIPSEIYFLTEGSDKPITVEICGDLIKTETAKMIFLFSPPVPTLKWFADFKFENEKYFKTDDGLIVAESDSEKCFYDFNMPLMFSEIRIENNTGVIDSTTKMPDANLEVVYEGLKDLPVYIMYPSGPTASDGMELTKKFGEILKEWKASQEN